MRPTFIDDIDSDWSKEEEPLTVPIVGSKKKASIKQDPSSTSSSDDDQQEMSHSSSSSSKSGKSIAPARIAIQIEEDSSDEDQSDSSEEESKGPNKKSSGEETDVSSVIHIIPSNSDFKNMRISFFKTGV